MNKQAVYIVYGVSGCGKTTIGKALAENLRIPFYDADDFHPLSNKIKMEKGEALNDADRAPWLTILSEQITNWEKNNGAVLACSALKEVYRKQLESDSQVNWIHLKGTKKIIEERLKLRKGHFFNSKLLDSQFQILELADYGISIDINNDIDSMINEIKTSEFFKHESYSTIGLVGLGVMGKSLAINWAKRGVSLSVFNRHVPNKEEGIAAKFIDEQPSDYQLLGFDNLKPFVNSLQKPRKIVLMVNAGQPVDSIIDELTPLLDTEDIIIDGGNSYFKDTEIRSAALAEKNIEYIGVGISGGEEGAKNGPSIMPGGTKKAYKAIQPYLKMIAAKDRNANACCTHIGPGGAGHFVKTMHNGIEYAEMQIIAEIYSFLRFQCNSSTEEIGNLFEKWGNNGLESYLLNITVKILRKKDDLSQGQLIDKIIDVANQKGTGGWSTNAALELGVPLNTISEAVMARNLSAQKDKRTEASTVYDFKPSTHF
ncbi:MAG: NADP-dependent phosphogluconate dehydrogenase, partial [Cyclobacteriaceae bacterium]|nr:NADP-dependent phosphogluconate dehydrogenase [Cyclobacteriaceae bacterium]